MATTVNNLPGSGTIAMNDFFHVIQDGIDRKTTFQNLVESIPAASESRAGLMDQWMYNSLFGYKGAADESTVNTCYNQGAYTLGSPLGSAFGLWGILLVFNIGLYKAQLILSAQGSIAYRINTGGDWREWFLK